jgi:hypothetical protein
MDWIVEGIALGNWQDARAHDVLQANGIRAVLQIYGPDASPPGFPFAEASLQLEAPDAIPLPHVRLRKGVEFIQLQREVGRPILVCCSAGLSRSPCFVAAYLHATGHHLPDAFRTILAARSGILPHPAVLRSLIQYCAAELSPAELLAAIVREKTRLARV